MAVKSFITLGPGVDEGCEHRKRSGALLFPEPPELAQLGVRHAHVSLVSLPLTLLNFFHHPNKLERLSREY
jgi:hypothetical protein